MGAVMATLLGGDWRFSNMAVKPPAGLGGADGSGMREPAPRCETIAFCVGTFSSCSACIFLRCISLSSLVSQALIRFTMASNLNSDEAMRGRFVMTVSSSVPTRMHRSLNASSVILKERKLFWPKVSRLQRYLCEVQMLNKS